MTEQEQPRTREVQFQCNHLSNYHGGVGEALLQIVDDKPTGIICTEYDEKTSGCKKLINLPAELREGHYERSGLRESITDKILSQRGIRKKGGFMSPPTYDARDAEMVASEVEAELKKFMDEVRAKREAYIIEQKDAWRCIASRGFRPLT